MNSFWTVLAIGGSVSLAFAIIALVFTLAFKIGDVVEDLTGKRWMGVLSYFSSLPLMFSLIIATGAEILTSLSK